jgi:hypothetical protein
LAAVADESNFDALVRMDSLPKAAFHRKLLRHLKYTQAYLDHAYNIVHDFRKCDIRVLHVINPKEEGVVQDDEEKKDSEREKLSWIMRRRKLVNRIHPRNRSKLVFSTPTRKIHLPT